MPQAFKIPILHTRIVQPMNSLTASPNNKKLIYTTTAKKFHYQSEQKVWTTWVPTVLAAKPHATFHSAWPSGISQQ